MANPSRTKTIVHTENAVPPLPVFSQATIANGIVYCSGSIGYDHQLNVVSGGVVAQTTRALENLAAVLAAAGSGIEHILKANVYLANMPRDFGPMNEAYIKVGTHASTKSYHAMRDSILAACFVCLDSAVKLGCRPIYTWQYTHPKHPR
ncbi:hypothetical protein FRC12_023577 [Ceratobasidium sp. 428]|nr:hypothetical protein FRC12_023577 [Ceratobasidium sp. 428]